MLLSNSSQRCPISPRCCCPIVVNEYSFGNNDYLNIRFSPNYKYNTIKPLDSEHSDLHRVNKSFGSNFHNIAII